MRKYLFLKFKKKNAEEFIKNINNSMDFAAEQLSEDTVKIITSSNTNLDILKNISKDFLKELNDINIENISMEDVIRKIYR